MKNKMRYFSMAVLFVAAATLMGCEKEEPAYNGDGVHYTTTVKMAGGNSKHLDADGHKTFAVGEQIAVIYKNTNGTTVKAVSAALTSSDIHNSGKVANFTVELENPDKTQNVTYIYPAAMANDDGTMADISSQDGTLASLSSNLDYCTYTGDWSAGNLPSGVTMDNQLAVCKFTVMNFGVSDITSSVTRFTVNDGTHNYTITRSAAAGPIYVALLPVSGVNIAFTATSSNGTTFECKVTGKTLAASKMYPITLSMAAPFSVSSTKKVIFSHGNLQATWNGSIWSWAFATNQWDYIGNAAGNTSINGNGTVSANNVTVDLFGWVGASSTWTGAAQYGISNSTTTNSTSTYGNVATEALKSDWGNTIGSGWRTLTKDEWTYVFNTRNGATSVNGTANARYTCATINTDVNSGVNGMILFPDGVTIASGEATSWGTINGYNSWGTKCTSAQWTALAAKGCVFLPAAGYRDGSSVRSTGSYGSYWSSSPNTSNVRQAYYAYFGSGSLSPAYGSVRNGGYSVRLVREVE